MQSCSASPGWYCSPLHQLVICPQDWYCPGGASYATRCPDGKWSAVGSAYPENCVDNMNAQLGVILLFIALIIAILWCMWATAREWMPYEYEYAPAYYQSKYGAIHRQPDVKLPQAQPFYYP